MESWVALEVSFSSTLKKNLLVWTSGLQKLEVRRRWEGRWGRMCKYQYIYIYIVSQLLKWSSWSWMHKMHVVCRNLYIFVPYFRNCVMVCDITNQCLTHQYDWPVILAQLLFSRWVHPTRLHPISTFTKDNNYDCRSFHKGLLEIMWKQSSKKTESQLHM